MNSFPIDNLYFANTGGISKFYYQINDRFYDAKDLRHVPMPNDLDEYSPFSINPNGSQLLVIQTDMEDVIYQQLPDGQFVKASRLEGLDEEAIFQGSIILEVPSRHRDREINGRYERLPLRVIDPAIVRRIIDNFTEESFSQDPYTQILNFLNEPVVIESNLMDESYEILLKQLYGLPVVLPEFLVINELKVNFIPFSEVSKIQIDRYLIDPLLQPWAGSPSSPNRILTIFGKNGMTYLVKAKYDQITNQIFSPI